MAADLWKSGNERIHAGYTPTPEPPLETQTIEALIVRESRNGWHVESQSATTATLVKGKPTSHLLHLILTILTLGLWLPVWICVAIVGGEKHKLVVAT